MLLVWVAGCRLPTSPARCERPSESCLSAACLSSRSTSGRIGPQLARREKNMVCIVCRSSLTRLASLLIARRRPTKLSDLNAGWLLEANQFSPDRSMTLLGCGAANVVQCRHCSSLPGRARPAHDRLWWLTSALGLLSPVCRIYLSARSRLNVTRDV